MITYEVQLLQERIWTTVFSCYDQYQSERVMIELQNKRAYEEQYRLISNENTI